MGLYDCHCPTCGKFLGYSKGPNPRLTQQWLAETYNTLVSHLRYHRRCLVAWSRALNGSMEADFKVPKWLEQYDEEHGAQIRSMAMYLKRKSQAPDHGKRKRRITFDEQGNGFEEVTNAKYNPYLIPDCNFVQ